MGLPGCLFVCHLILLLMCFLFNLNVLRSHTGDPVSHMGGHVLESLGAGVTSVLGTGGPVLTCTSRRPRRVPQVLNIDLGYSKPEALPLRGCSG